MKKRSLVVPFLSDGYPVEDDKYRGKRNLPADTGGLDMKKNLTGARAVDGSLDHFYLVVGGDLEGRVRVACLDVAVAGIRDAVDGDGNHDCGGIARAGQRKCEVVRSKGCKKKEEQKKKGRKKSEG